MEILEAFNFCPRCGKQFEKRKNHLHCPACGLDQYVNPKPTATIVLVNSKDELLMVERAVDPGKGLWDFPGGFVEDNETFEENAQREAEEELGIKLGKLTYIGSTTSPYLFQAVRYPTLAAVYISRLLPKQELKALDDVASCKFFAANELPRSDFAFPAMNTISILAIEFLKNNKL